MSSDLLRITTVSAAGLLMIANFEGLRTDSYLDAVGIPTICYGSTTNVVIGVKKTKTECWNLLEKEVKSFTDGVVKSLPYTVHLSQKELDAYVSFAYNVGLGNWSSSTLLKKLKRGDRIGACMELNRWVYAKKKKLPGLVNRRKIESEICQQGVKGEHEAKSGFWSDYYRYPLGDAHGR